MNKDSLANTLIVSLALCLACSAIVSLAAVGLKPVQDKNRALDRKKNVLIAAGLARKSETVDVEKIFSTMIDDRIIDLDTGADVTTEYGDQVASFDPEAGLQDPSKSKVLTTEQDLATVKKRENRAHLYIVKTSSSDPTPTKYVFPMRGRGLWSTMKGFLAVNADLRTASAVTFYEDAETPGLGGEINSEAFQSLWPGKVVFDSDGEVVLRISKSASGDREIASLSGATITSVGVQKMVQFWLGAEGFGKYIDQLRNGNPEPRP
jgi:Na+-transporting NADH:ubiquinone oxidoreductase subunit C